MFAARATGVPVQQVARRLPRSSMHAHTARLGLLRGPPGRPMVVTRVARIINNSTLSELGTGKYTTTKELELTRMALNDTVEKMTALEKQVSAVDSLQQQVADQDGVILQLKKMLGGKEKQAATDGASAQEVIELQAKLLDAKAELKNKQAARIEAQRTLSGSLAAAESSLKVLKEKVNETSELRTQMEAEAEAARKISEATAAKLEKAMQDYKAMEEECEKLRKDALEGGGTAVSGGPRGKGMTQKQATQALKQALEHIKEVNAQLKRENAVAAERSKEKAALEEREAEQEAKLEMFNAEMVAIKKQLKEKISVLKEVQEAEVERDPELDAKRRSQLKEETSSKEAALKAEAELSYQVEKLSEERDKLSSECERLRKLLTEVEERNQAQNKSLSELEQVLEDLSSDVIDARKLREDMAMVKSTLESREQELSKVRMDLREALQRESDIHTELVGAHEGMIRLQTMLGELNTTNHDLLASLAAMDAEVRLKDTALERAEEKLTGAENKLKELSEQILQVNSDLETKARALVEAGEKLKASAATEATQLARMQTLMAELDRVKEQAAADVPIDGATAAELASLQASNASQQGLIDSLVVELQHQKRALREAQDKASTKAASRREMGVDEEEDDVAELRQQLVTATQDNKELIATLEASVKQVEALQALDEQRMAELRAAQDKSSAMSQEVNELQQQLRSMSVGGVEKPAVESQAVAQLAEKELQLREAAAEKQRAEEEALALRQQVEALSAELRMVQQGGSSAPPLGAGWSAAFEGDVQELVAQLQEEVMATNDLLLKAEDLVKSSVTTAREQQLKVPIPEVNVESIREMVQARDKALSYKLEAEGLRERIQKLEASISKKDQDMKDVLQLTGKGGGQVLKELTKKVELLTEENTMLKAAALETEQSVGQARKFLMAKFQSLASAKAVRDGGEVKKMKKRVKKIEQKQVSSESL